VAFGARHPVHGIIRPQRLPVGVARQVAQAAFVVDEIADLPQQFVRNHGFVLQ